VALTEAVAAAVDEIRARFPDMEIITQEDGEGGAYVIIEGVPLGGPYAAATTWIGFRITFTYPYSDVYPHYARGDLTRTDGRPLGDAMSTTNFQGRSAIQLSRSSPKRDAAVDGALMKLLRVLDWLRSRP
jgi:hypothetical protein